MLETYLERSFLFETCKCQLVELATIDTIASTTLQQDIEVHAVKICTEGTWYLINHTPLNWTAWCQHLPTNTTCNVSKPARQRKIKGRIGRNQSCTDSAHTQEENVSSYSITIRRSRLELLHIDTALWKRKQRTVHFYVQCTKP